MITIEEMKNCILYKKPFYAPFNDKDKKKGSLIYLLTNSFNSSLELMNNKFMMNNKYFHSYYVEKDITYYINNEGYLIEADNIPYNVFTESGRQYLNDTSRYVQALQLENFECTNTANKAINESIEDDIMNIDYQVKILENIMPKYLTKIEKDNIKNMVISKADFYYNKVSRNWSIRDKQLKYPYRNKQSVYSLEFSRKYLNTMSSKCILPRDFDNKKDKLSVLYFKDDDNWYTAILLFDDYNIKNIWFVFNKELISLYPFINECVTYRNEGNIEQEIEENNERKKFESGDLIRLSYTTEGYELSDYYYRDNNTIIIFNEALENIQEASKGDAMLRKLLFKERLKTNKEVFKMYENIKKEKPEIQYTYIDINKYKSLNLFVDLHYYNKTFFKNNIYKLDKAAHLYFSFINNMITDNDSRFTNAGYVRKTVFLNLNDWRLQESKLSIFNYKDDINPISVLLRYIKFEIDNLKETWKGITFVLFSDNCYMKINIDDLEEKDYTFLKIQIQKMLDKSFVPEDPQDETKDSKKAIVAAITDKLEDNKKIKVHNLTGDSKDINKDELVNKIEKAAATSNTVDDAIDKLEDDEKIKDIINQLQLDVDDGPNMNASRKARISKLQKDFLDKNLEGKTVRQLIEDNDKLEELPVTKLELDSVNEEWKNLQYMNFDKSYDLRSDILNIIYSFSEKQYPVAVVDLTIEDTSTTEDFIETFVMKMEDSMGNRFTIKLDIPRLKDDKFMILRGNEKTISGQQVLLPISKTEEDTVQIVSNYNKIFIRTYGTSVAGRRFAGSDLIIKSVSKCDDIKTTVSDNTKICSKYELPLDYIDLASIYGIMETNNYIFYFNQDEIREKYNIDIKNGVPFGYDKKQKKVLYFTDTKSSVSESIINLLKEDVEGYDEILSTCKLSNKYHYSQASILNSKIPLVVIMGYNEGLVSAMNKAKIKYEIVEKRPKSSLQSNFIRFNDGYIVYENTIESSLFMNGLKECNTENYSLSEMNSKAMFIDFLEIFGGRILSDGLDNFYDLQIDPITKEVLEDYKLPTTYMELLGYANSLLADNKYIDHTDLSSNRYRSNEIIAGYTYKALADSYGRYRTGLKRSNKSTMSIKQSQVIDNIMLDPTASDASILNPLLEIETMNAVSFKGLSGMNSDRSYSLDKRTFGDSMLNILAMSTGFAGNVGITRQATIDMNITGKRGYIKQLKDTDELNITKTFCMTEALVPYGATHDDPFRMAMGFIQNSKHAMKTKISSPQLISNGADQALPYMITNNFAFKAKEDGKVIELNDKYCVIKYKTGKHEFIDLRDNVKKNSNAGFYTSIKLSTKLKLNQTVKEGDILAYDESFFSDMIGQSGNLAYNAGIFTKVAVVNTDEGFEDSAIITEWLSHAMASNVTVLKQVVLPKTTNVLKMLKKGDSVQEGDEILLFQNSYDEEDVNMLLNTLSDDIDEITDLGKIPLKSKITGIIKDIKVYRTVEKDELSPSLKKIVNDIEKESNDISKIAKKYGVNHVPGLNPNYKLESSGKLKNVEDGVLIEFYLEYEDLFSIGDKLIYYSAVKGVDKDIIKSGDEPYTNREPDEPIDSLVPLGGISARMVTSVENIIACNKVIMELDKCIKRKAGIKIKPLRQKLERR